MNSKPKPFEAKPIYDGGIELIQRWHEPGEGDVIDSMVIMPEDLEQLEEALVTAKRWRQMTCEEARAEWEKKRDADNRCSDE